MNTLRIAICEDSAADMQHLCALIAGADTPTSVASFPHGGAFLASLPAGRFDLVFLDIYMPGIGGVETARTLREADAACHIVFTTTSTDHMPEAFDVGARQYLVKPVDGEKLYAILESCYKDARQRKTCPVNVRGVRTQIPFDDICYVEVHNHNCAVHTVDGVIETGTSMSIEDFVQLLPAPAFYRCHKSYIVSFRHVREIGRDFTMQNGDVVYIRRGDVARCKRELQKWQMDMTEQGEP